MSIFAAQLSNVSSLTASVGSKQVPASPAAPSTARVHDATRDPRSAKQADSSVSQYNLAVRTDKQGRAYYAVISERTGDVIYQIPPEQVRKVAEGIGELLKQDKSAQSLDVKL
jgi:uncharacterized protein (DUF885 family)